MTYNCLIVDDERPALKLLTAYISKLPHLNLLDSCENAMQAIAALQKNKTDLLFLDIQMPELTGLDLLKILKVKPQVILTTAYRDYAVEGFALDVTDYLLKPFSFERFTQAVTKATDRIQSVLQQPTIQAIDVQAEKTADHFFVRTNYKMEKIKTNKILYIESMREYIAIHLPNHRYVINQTMTKMENELPKNRFMRIHRSYIIGLNHIDGIDGNQVIIGQNKLPIGASYRKKFFEQLRTL